MSQLVPGQRVFHDDMKAVFQGMVAQIADQMLDERVDERAGAHRSPDPAEPYPPPRFSETAFPAGFPRPCHEPADGTENEA
ncbi:hypothetical protein ACFH04_00325 [Streptomyces noboritoensis]|uniref:Transposase n=1 Tax=Streptomyces noboritoensis TaxID=67337 RepID=A0ABV6TAD2_9ACTN